jgi:hypothetical protein
VGADDTLNTVSLFLPNFNEAAVDAVLTRLSSDPDRVPPIQAAKTPVSCLRNSSIPVGIFATLSELPTYLVPGPVRRSQVARLNALAALLTGDGIDNKAMETGTALLLDTLDAQRKRLDSEGSLTPAMDALRVLDVQVKKADILTGESLAREAMQAELDHRNIDDLLKQAGRTLRDGLAITYWKHRVTDDKADPTEQKLETCVLAGTSPVVEAVESAAEQQVQSWMNSHDRDIRALSDSRRQRYYLIQHQDRRKRVRAGIDTSTLTIRGRTRPS